MEKILYMLKQLFPLTYWTIYKTPDAKKHFVIWRQWFGKIYNKIDISVIDDKEFAKSIIKCLRTKK